MEKSKKKWGSLFSGRGKKGLVARLSVALSLLLVTAIVIMLLTGHSQLARIASSFLAGATGSSIQSGSDLSGTGSTAIGNHGSKAKATGTVKATGTASVTSTATMPLQSMPASAADVTVDFGSRQNTAYPIPSTYLGVGGVGLKLILKNNANAVLQANFHLTKLGDYDFMGEIFPTAASATNPTQQNWTLFDEEMALAAQYHMQPIISLEYTPPWLQPQNQSPAQTNPCLTYNPPLDPHSVKPMYLVNGQDQGPQMWGKLAALVVAHVDQKFAGSHAMYEIWNQPDGTQFLCMPASDQNAEQDMLTAYRAIFAAAAPLMKQQASRDGMQIQIGGPDLVYALQSHLTWLTTFLNDPAIYPYVDFITYHRYLAGSSFNSGSGSLVGLEQDANLGVAAQYEQVVRIVRSGKQPNAANTPIYIDEYSMSSCTPVVCQNDPTFSPLMNALFVIDYLNAANDTKSAYGAAGVVPAGLAFYSWDIPLHYLCMFGAFDASMDCGAQSGTYIQPYPDYYTYLLFGGSNYVGMTDGGYVATTTLVKPQGVSICGLFSRSKDSVIVVNPTSQAFTTMHIFVQNPGSVSGTQANLFTLKFSSSNPSSSITTTPVQLVPVTGGSGYMATITVPAYTTVALSVAAQ